MTFKVYCTGASIDRANAIGPSTQYKRASFHSYKDNLKKPFYFLGSIMSLAVSVPSYLLMSCCACLEACDAYVYPDDNHDDCISTTVSLPCTLMSKTFCDGYKKELLQSVTLKNEDIKAPNPDVMNEEEYSSCITQWIISEDYLSADGLSRVLPVFVVIEKQDGQSEYEIKEFFMTSRSATAYADKLNEEKAAAEQRPLLL
jgi:hypothetical protein